MQKIHWEKYNIILTAALFLVIAGAVYAYFHISAATNDKYIVVNFDNSELKSEGQTLYLPLRSLAGALNYSISVTPNTQQIILAKNNHTIRLRPGAEAVLHNGTTLTLGQAVKIYDNEPFVPLESLRTIFGMDSEWHNFLSQLRFDTTTVAKNELPVQVKMPGFENYPKAMAEYYGFYFLEDGFPARYINNLLVESPIIPIYVIDFYIREYTKSPNDIYLQQIIKVADAALKRMDDYEDALVFWYPQGKYVSRAYKIHYSGLTQAYYAYYLHTIYQLTGIDKYKNAAYKAYLSLKIPKERNGVMHQWQDGVSIEEIAQIPNGFILNGWLTTMCHLQKYATLSDNNDAKFFFEQNVQALAKIIHLFDAPEYKNSRYALSGFQYFKLNFEDNEDVKISHISLEVPRDSIEKIAMQDNSNHRWQSYIFADDVIMQNNDEYALQNKSLKFNLVLSRISLPETNKLHLNIYSPKAQKVSVQTFSGEYNPLFSAPVNNTWKDMASVELVAGNNKITVSLDWSYCNLIGYPTNFAKKIDNKQYNVYHYVHIKQLQLLYATTNIAVFKQYAEHWQNYIEEWPAMEIYKVVEHTPH